MKKRIITICTSVSFYKQALDLQKELRKKGFHVIVPSTAYVMKKTGVYDEDVYKTWFKNKEDYHKKTAVMLDHFKKVRKADAILVLNLEKRNIKGYIGGNVLMEMTFAFLHKKPIFVYNMILDSLPIAEEVYGLQPIFLQGDLSKIILKKKSL